jgi:hypothetical protein
VALTVVESRRKHGAFDLRFPALSMPPTPAWGLDADRGLEWTEFQTRFFPGRHRHDIEALAAYGAYRGISAQRCGEGGRKGRVRRVAGRGRAATSSARRLERRPARWSVTAASPALTTWENEGGATGPGAES